LNIKIKFRVYHEQEQLQLRKILCSEGV